MMLESKTVNNMHLYIFASKNVDRNAGIYPILNTRTFAPIGA